MKSVKSPKTAAAKPAKPAKLAKAVKPAKAVKAVRKAPQKAAPKLPADTDQLILENITAITLELQAITRAVDDHVMKTVNIANHVVALEAVLAEVVALTGLDMVKVNNRIRAKVSTASVQPGASDYAIDLAASIVSPAPRI